MDPQTDLRPCYWAFCIDAPVARNDSMLSDLMYNDTEYEYFVTEVEIGDPVEYYCFNGMKHATNLSFTHQEAICHANNTWEAPDEWEQCVHSEW